MVHKYFSHIGNRVFGEVGQTAPTQIVALGRFTVQHFGVPTLRGEEEIDLYQSIWIRALHHMKKPNILFI